MKTKSFHTLSIKITSTLAALFFTSSIYAAYAPAGAYFYLGGGGVFIQHSVVGSTTIFTTALDSFRHESSITYSEKGGFDFTGRAALGYLFYHDDPCEPQVHHFGLEAGYNYFIPMNSSANNSVNVTIIHKNYGVLTTQRTTVWSTDLLGVYRKTLNFFGASVFVKFGIAYEDVTNKITNTVADLPDELPHHITQNPNGIGGAGGIGFDIFCSKHVGFQFELDGMKGGKNIGYVQGLIGLTLFT